MRNQRPVKIFISQYPNGTFGISETAEGEYLIDERVIMVTPEISATEELAAMSLEDLCDEAEVNIARYVKSGDMIDTGLVYDFILDLRTKGKEIKSGKAFRDEVAKVLNWSDQKGVEDATWGDTRYDSMSAVAGYNQCLQDVFNHIQKAIDNG